MREIAATLSGIFMVLYIMYFFIPMLSSTHTTFSSLVNSSDPVIANSYNLGQGFYTVGPLVPIFVSAFIIISAALKRGPDE